MNSYFGVDPEAIDGVRDLGVLLNILTAERGRFIYDLPEKWADKVLHRLNNLSEIDKLRVVEILTRGATKATLQPPPKEQKFFATSWQQNASRIRGEPILMGVVGSTPPVRPIWDVLADPNSLPPSGSSYVRLKASDMVDAFTPLLSVSTKIVLVDPYIRIGMPGRRGEWLPSKLGMPVLKELMRVAGKARAESFDVYSSSRDGGGMENDSDGENSSRVLEGVRNSLGFCSHLKVRCIPLESIPEGTLIDNHDRHLLGNDCGISSGRGFSEHSTFETKLQWIGGSALSKLLDTFI